MRVVDVCVDSEQSFEDDLDDCLEVAWEGYSEGAREDFLVVQLILHPCHQEVNVFSGADLEWCLDVVTISPQVLILWPCRHGWARFSGAELSQNSIEDINLVVKLDGVDGEPLIQILASGKLHRQLHVATSKRHTRDLFESITASTLLDLFLLLE